MKLPVPLTSIHRIEADGVTVFYREAGSPTAPVILLLHGFPTSSFQYRELIPRLADEYRVIAPDLPGFASPRSRNNATTPIPSIPSPKRSLPSPTRCTSTVTRSMSSITAHRPAFA